MAAGLCALALPAAAQTAATTEFTVGDVAIELPLPAGFCPANGVGVQVAKIVAAADKDNATDLTLFPCNDQSGTAPDYYLVKTPASMLAAKSPRADILASLKAEFDKPGFAEALEAADINGKTSEAYSKLMQQKAEVSGKVEPMGIDETCAYMGGVMHFQSAATRYSRAISACITSVGDRVVMIYRYSQGEPGNVLARMKSAKALALAMKPKPAP